MRQMVENKKNKIHAKAVDQAVETAFPRWLTMAVLTALAVLALASVANARPAPESFGDMAEALLPSVVNISTTQLVDAGDRNLPMTPEEFFQDFFNRRNGGDGGGDGGNGDGAPPDQPSRKRKATALGSGFIVDPSGLVVTNNHVIEGADEITVILQDDTALKAKVMGRDPKTDIALLKVDSKRPLPALAWGDSDALRVGDWVLAIGNPFGLGGSVTAGIVSARARDISSGPYDDYIQTDASINRGNSGGPLFNMNGEVVGINTAIYSPAGSNGGSVGIGFSRVSNQAKVVVEDLKKYGRTRRGWLGVRIQKVTPDIAESLGMKNAVGALVATVEDGGPAAVAGLKPRDVIVEFNGRPVDQMRRLPRIVAETPIDETVPLKYWRDGRMNDAKVKVGELAETATEDKFAKTGEAPPVDPKAGSDSLIIKDLGIEVASLTDVVRERFNIPADATGVAVLAVEPGSNAEEKDFQPGDVIVEAHQQNVAKPADVERQVAAAKKAGLKAILLLVQNETGLQYVPLKLK